MAENTKKAGPGTARRMRTIIKTLWRADLMASRNSPPMLLISVSETPRRIPRGFEGLLSDRCSGIRVCHGTTDSRSRTVSTVMSGSLINHRHRPVRGARAGLEGQRRRWASRLRPPDKGAITRSCTRSCTRAALGGPAHAALAQGTIGSLRRPEQAQLPRVCIRVITRRPGRAIDRRVGGCPSVPRRGSRRMRALPT